VLQGTWWVVSLSPLRKWLRRRRLGIVSGYYYRNVKPEWSLIKNRALVSELNYVKDMPKEPVIGAALLKLMARGDIAVTMERGGTKNATNLLKIVHPTQPSQEKPSSIQTDEELCTFVLYMLTEAAGEDKVLQPKEFSTWAKKHRTTPRKLLDALDKEAEKAYIDQNAASLFGLKAFLKDFTLQNERHMMEVKLWDQYMVYAQFFGLTKQVMRDMKKVCPEYLQMSSLAQSVNVSQMDFTYMWTDTIYDAVTSSAPVSSSRKSSSHSSSGFSSFSSHSGGGGYSGGGGGGGR
jgi:hypothetical protein